MFRSSFRLLASQIPSDCTQGERKLYEKLVKALSPSTVSVSDISGGCGSMYAVEVASSKFKGIPMVKQHQMINEILKDDIKQFHGIRIKTSE